MEELGLQVGLKFTRDGAKTGGTGSGARERRFRGGARKGRLRVVVRWLGMQSRGH
ncbi:hypothetical protein L484_025741 [Morus notabilis]|uniref:Uncharacterized protein n=1 Tax=Morus notabilis TaxID=981085 RepID=W9RED4_9ROSA|nr:hypothetical protein L484_025741 [Morus notabilis]